MNWLALVPILVPLLQSISHAWGSATGNSLQRVGAILLHAPEELVNALADAGAKEFPQLDSTLHAAAAALLAAESHTGAAYWMQDSLNFAQKIKVVQFAGTGPAGGNTPLTRDGIWGPRSQGALKAFQAAMHLPVTGMFADAELAAINALLAKK